MHHDAVGQNSPSRLEIPLIDTTQEVAVRVIYLHRLAPFWLFMFLQQLLRITAHRSVPRCIRKRLVRTVWVVEIYLHFEVANHAHGVLVLDAAPIEVERQRPVEMRTQEWNHFLVNLRGIEFLWQVGSHGGSREPDYLEVILGNSMVSIPAVTTEGAVFWQTYVYINAECIPIEEDEEVLAHGNDIS